MYECHSVVVVFVFIPLKESDVVLLDQPLCVMRTPFVGQTLWGGRTAQPTERAVPGLETSFV